MTYPFCTGKKNSPQFQPTGTVAALILQSEQNVTVHLIITIQKHVKIFLTGSITYHNKVVRIRDNR
jgi:hypothetical protein